MLDQFKAEKVARLRTLDDISQVTASAVRLVGWVSVTGAARVESLGDDPDSEKLAITTVVSELAKLGYESTTARPRAWVTTYMRVIGATREQRLVEVKGVQGDLRAIWLEQNEWAQAKQRRNEYWLYVVDSCATSPAVRLRQQDPAGVLGVGPRRIERFQISLSELRRLMGARSWLHESSTLVLPNAPVALVGLLTPGFLAPKSMSRSGRRQARV